MDYWKERPAKLLLDERLTGMTPEELAAWFWLRQRARTQTPPGILPGDEQQLLRWSGLKPKQWREAKDAVLKMFVQDEQGRLHDAQIRTEYGDFCHASHKFSVEQARKSAKRWGKKDPDPKFVDPYAELPIPRYPVGFPLHTNGISQNGDSAAETPVDPTASRGIAAASRGIPNNLLIKKIDYMKGDDPPPATAAAVTPASPIAPSRPPPSHQIPLPSPEVLAERASRSAAGKAALEALVATQSKNPPPAAVAAGDAETPPYQESPQ